MRLIRAIPFVSARAGAVLLSCLLLCLLGLGCTRPGVTGVNGASGANGITSVTGVTTVFLVRHAEKQDTQDPDLTEAGQQRALALAQSLRSVPLDGIYSTDTQRTRQTAAPVAEARSLEVALYGTGDMDHLVTKLRSTPGRYLVVGHSNTTPDLVTRLGGEPGAVIDEASEFDRLYVLTLHPDGSVSTLLLRYGAE